MWCRQLLVLLQDESRTVRNTLIRRLPGTLAMFVPPDAAGDARAGAELAQALTAAHAAVGLDWRAHESLLLAFPALTQVSHLILLLTYSSGILSRLVGEGQTGCMFNLFKPF
jgi:hypothetical protein